MLLAKSYIAIIILSIAGMGIAGYLTWYEIVVPVGVCPINVPFISCSAALTSAYSRIGGVSVASLGLAWFLGAALLGVLTAENQAYLKLLLAWSIIAVVGMIYLVLVEVFLLGEICPFCTSAHVLGIGIVAITVKLWMDRGSHKS